MHKTTGRWKYGLLLSATTVLMWAVLPLALKILLDHMDAFTITWYRFVSAALIMGIYLIARRRLPALKTLSRVGWLLLALAIFGLAGNYLLYLISLDRISPGVAQVVIQLAPMMLLLGGLVVFGERFNGLQWTGLVTLLAGFVLFFNHKLLVILSQADAYSIGILIMLGASASWAVYALAQKQLLSDMGSDQIMFLIYLSSVFLFWPASEPASLGQLNGAMLALLAFASINTLIAYGAFAEALNHWEASRVSAILAITPLLSLVAVEVLHAARPDLMASENLSWLSVAGALLVVVGSMMTALARSPKPAEA